MAELRSYGSCRWAREGDITCGKGHQVTPDGSVNAQRIWGGELVFPTVCQWCGEWEEVKE